MSELLWVAVPSGFAMATTALLRVMVVPRLQAGTLGNAGLQDWPALLADASLNSGRSPPKGCGSAGASPSLRHRARSEIGRRSSATPAS
jgi:hypothetical protein